MGSPVDRPSYPTLRLRKGHDRRLLRGHPWIFSNELEPPEESLVPGDFVRVHDGRDRFAGIGYVNPRSLIMVRLLRRDDGPVDIAFIAARLEAAVALRERFYPDCEAVRLFNSESDGLPGLILDRYGDHVVVQATTAGIERMLPDVLEWIRGRFSPRCIIARNDTHFRELEGLKMGVEVLDGEPDEDLTVDYEGLTLAVDLLGGQKTGLFLDQRDNHRRFARLAFGEVLDCFCYQGTWGLLALSGGAERVVGVDSSGEGLAMAARHAQANGSANRAEWIGADVLDTLKRFRSQGRRFDTVVLDPPAFVKSRKHVKAGLRGYLDLNRKGLDVVKDGGIMITCSCSHHVRSEVFRDTVSHSASLAGRHVRVIGVGSQSRDHAPLLTAPETDYLKCLVLHVA